MVFVPEGQFFFCPFESLRMEWFAMVLNRLFVKLQGVYLQLF